MLEAAICQTKYNEPHRIIYPVTRKMSRQYLCVLRYISYKEGGGLADELNGGMKTEDVH